MWPVSAVPISPDSLDLVVTTFLLSDYQIHAAQRVLGTVRVTDTVSSFVTSVMTF